MHWRKVVWVVYAIATELVLLLDWFLAIRYGESGNVLGVFTNTLYSIGVIGFALSLKIWTRVFWTVMFSIAIFGTVLQVLGLLIAFSDSRLYNALFGMAVFVPTLYALWRYQQKGSGIWGFEWGSAKATAPPILLNEGQIRVAFPIESAGSKKDGAVTLLRVGAGYEVHMSVFDGSQESSFRNEFADERSALRFILANTHLTESDFRVAAPARC